MKKIIIVTAMVMALTYRSGAQTGTVDIYWHGDSSMNMTIKWNDMSLSYDEVDHRFFRQPATASCCDKPADPKKKRKLKTSYVFSESFTVDLSEVSTPNGVLRAVNHAYADGSNKENLSLLMPDSIDMTPDLLLNRKTNHALTSFFYTGRSSRVYMEKKGAIAKAVIEDVSYQGSSFDSIPWNQPIQHVKLKQKDVFNALEDPAKFQYAPTSLLLIKDIKTPQPENKKALASAN